MAGNYVYCVLLMELFFKITFPIEGRGRIAVSGHCAYNYYGCIMIRKYACYCGVVSKVSHTLTIYLKFTILNLIFLLIYLH